MDLTGAGTAIMVAIAAVLWFAYFVPTWVARREYLDTERTATRLQQTLRIMAETAEVPEQVRVEVTAREAARQERMLRAQQRDRERALDREEKALARRARDAAAVSMVSAASTAPTAPTAPMARRSTGADLQRLRRRRAHRLATVLLLASTITIAVQLWLVASSGAVVGSWIVLAAGAGLGLVAVSIRRRLDGRAVASTPAASARAARPAFSEPVVVTERGRPSTWTPVPVPAPLYLSRPAAQTVAPAPDVAAQLRRAALAAEESLRAAHAEPEVVPFRPAAAASTAPSRWAGMGRLDPAAGETSVAAPDLDEVLRRRRNAG